MRCTAATVVLPLLNDDQKQDVVCVYSDL